MFSDKASKKCLVVDDDPYLTETLTELLISRGHEANGITFKGYSDELFHKVYDEYYDILILGIMMPGITGLEFTRRIRDQGLNIPIILMTGFSIPIRAIESMRSGADDLIIKPFGVDDLNYSIEIIFKQGGEEVNKGKNQKRYMKIKHKGNYSPLISKIC
jgi:DNA-binding response OmpR family regulator